MKTRLITAVLACALLSFAGQNAFAQQRGGWGDGPQGERPDPAQMAKRQADQMKTELKLTDDQYTKVLNLYKKQSEDMQKMMQSGDRPDRESMQASREKYNAEIKKVLTDDQYKKWSELEKNRRRGPGGPGGPDGPDGQGGPRN